MKPAELMRQLRDQERDITSLRRQVQDLRKLLLCTQDFVFLHRPTCATVWRNADTCTCGINDLRQGINEVFES